MPNLSNTGTAALSHARSHSSFDGHEYVIFVTDKPSGLRAFIAIHSTALGPAHGGTRMKEYADETEALNDALNLSKAMSFKSALAQLPYGGAKGVIMYGQQLDRKKVLKAYAEKIEKMNGLFRTGTDVGLTDADTTFMAQYSSYILGLPKKNKNGSTTSYTAAKGVFYAIKAAVRHKYGSDDLSGKTVGVKGVGKLGGELVRLLVAAKANVLVADTDPEKLKIIKKNFPTVEIVKPDMIHEKPMHIYAPCAFGDEFNKRTIQALSCDIIAGGANNQLSDDKAGDELHAKGIIYVPDYIANAGGLIFVSEDLESDGFHPERVERRLDTIKETISTVLDQSTKKGLPSHRIADMIARERIGKINT
jgi:leucine dehydrogenase